MQQQNAKDGKGLTPGIFTVPNPLDDDGKSEPSYKEGSVYHSCDQLVYNAPGLRGRSVSDTNIARNDQRDDDKSGCSLLKCTVAVLAVFLAILIVVFVVMYKLGE